MIYKKVTYIGYLASIVLLLGCGDANTTTESIPVLDADTVSAPVPTEQDTTLQPVIEVTLKAVGDTEEEMAFDQDTIQVKPGAVVKLFLINEGTDQSMIHNVVFTQPGKYKLVALAGAKIGAPGNYVPDSETVIAASPLALPGQTVELEFTAPVKPGSYHYVCTYPGHWKRMNGILLVK